MFATREAFGDLVDVVVVLFLSGTGAGVATKFRNVPGLHVFFVSVFVFF